MRPDWEVLSAGVAAVTGAPASKNAREVAAEQGLELAGHKARRVQDVSLEECDRIFTMTKEHLLGLPEQTDGAAVLSSVVGVDEPIGDPFGGDLKLYRKVFFEIKGLLDRLLESQGKTS